ncbi:hypothetical protein M409DRAFT_24850 [Zasmidium cellare ATCC 36951]|uniref:Replication protein A C-terminal domain-containing protein n=1 Tax=Zasmidium cellare ATCC 36951 TaxID=1080233 RepID=A0A6A6CFL2_ZASCE|nr:uncharacterized protein M409DRAFT_24850 [Zasmidium cellare ATCC 36951]KAF2164948.1 hypothetical protein M409DRAFT_24850 [Zasmidium cellare ATCC 36951]
MGTPLCTTSYGAQGGADGGGFMPGSQGEGNAVAKRGYGSDNLRPVTIKQLLGAEHPNPDADYFMLDGNEMKQVTFVGQVRNISTQTTNVTYKLDDGTGTIEVKVWIDAEAMQNDEMDMGAGKKKPAEQGYARVWGRLKDFNNRRHVGATVIRPIEDPNEITYHLLEATVVHLHFTKGPLETQQANGGATNGHAAQQQITNGYSGGGGGGDSGDVLRMQGVSQMAKKMFACLKQTPQTNEGLHAQDIATRLGVEITEVKKASDELMGLGKVYTTVDDDTWALLDI